MSSKIQDFARRFLKRTPALTSVPANTQAIDESLRSKAFLVIESTSGAVVMGRYVPNERKGDPYWIMLGKCVRSDDLGEDHLAGYKIQIDAIKQLYYVKEL